MALTRMVVNVEEDLLKQVDEYAASLHITRTAGVAVLLSQALQAQKTLKNLDEMMQAYRAEKAAEKA